MTFQQIAEIAKNDGLSYALAAMPAHWTTEYKFATYGARLQFTCGNGKEFTLYPSGLIVKGRE